MPPEEHIKKMEMLSSEQKRKREDSTQEGPQTDEPTSEATNGMSKRQMKKMAKLAEKAKKQRVNNERLGEKCLSCPNLAVSNDTQFDFDLTLLLTVQFSFFRGSNVNTNSAGRAARKSAKRRISPATATASRGLRGFRTRRKRIRLSRWRRRWRFDAEQGVIPW